MEQIAPNIFSNIFQVLNNSKLFSAFIMVMMNLGSKYISIDMCNFHEKILSSFIVRKIAIFAIFWMATKDIVLSLVLTVAFSFVVSGLFNDKSILCIIPKKNIFMNEHQKKISKQDYESAQNVIKVYENQNNHEKYYNNLYEIEQKKKKKIYQYNKWMLKNYNLHS